MHCFPIYAAEKQYDANPLIHPEENLRLHTAKPLQKTPLQRDFRWLKNQPGVSLPGIRTDLFNRPKILKNQLTVHRFSPACLIFFRFA